MFSLFHQNIFSLGSCAQQKINFTFSTAVITRGGIISRERVIVTTAAPDRWPGQAAELEHLSHGELLYPEKIVLSYTAALQYFSRHPAGECLCCPERSMGTDLDTTVASDAGLIVKADFFLFHGDSPGRAVLPAFSA